MIKSNFFKMKLLFAIVIALVVIRKAKTKKQRQFFLKNYENNINNSTRCVYVPVHFDSFSLLIWSNNKVYDAKKIIINNLYFDKKITDY